VVERRHGLPETLPIFGVVRSLLVPQNIATDALYGIQVQGLEASVESSNDRKAKKYSSAEKSTMSEDVKMLEEMNVEDILWSKKGWDVGEAKLRSRIDKACGHGVTDRQFFALKYYADSEASYFSFIGKSVYSSWKNEKRKSKAMLDNGSIKVMAGFAKLFDTNQVEKLDAVNKGGMALLKEYKKEQAAKKAVKGGKTSGM